MSNVGIFTALNSSLVSFCLLSIINNHVIIIPVNLNVVQNPSVYIFMYRFLQSDFKEYGISITHCPIYTETDSPVSVVIVNRKSGSRTILHTNK